MKQSVNGFLLDVAYKSQVRLPIISDIQEQNETLLWSCSDQDEELLQLRLLVRRLDEILGCGLITEPSQRGTIVPATAERCPVAITSVRGSTAWLSLKCLDRVTESSFEH